MFVPQSDEAYLIIIHRVMMDRYCSNEDDCLDKTRHTEKYCYLYE